MLIRNTIARLFAARDLRPTPEWSRAHVKLFPPLLLTGAYNPDISPHFNEPLACLRDDFTREVNVLKPVRDGGTLIGDLDFLWSVVNDPGPYLGIFQGDRISKDHAETRIWPMMEAIPAIMAKMPVDRHAARTQEILFADRNPAYFWGPSIGNLQSKGFRRLRAEEIWIWPKGVLSQLKGRRGDFERFGLDKLFCNSQGGYKENMGPADKCNDWWLQFSSGRLNEFFVPCSKCGHYQLPKIASGRAEDRAGLVWDAHRDERGFWDIAKCVPTVRFECAHCAHVHTDSTVLKTEWTRRAAYHYQSGEEWLPRTNASFVHARIESFRWAGVFSQCGTKDGWQGFLSKWLTALNHAHAGDHTDKIDFVQKQIPDFYDPNTFDDFVRLPTVEVEIRKRSDDSVEPILWTDETTGEEITFIHRHLMLDVSLRRLWAVASAWSDTGDDLTLEAREIPAEPSGRFRYEDVEAMQKQWSVTDQDVGWDVNYEERAQEVIEEIVKHGHFEGKNWLQWIGYRGSPKENFPYHPKGKRLRLLPVVMEPKLIERIDPCPGILDPRRAPEFFAKDPAGIVFKKFALIWQWSKPYFSALLEARRDGRAPGIRSVSLKGAWNENFDRHMHGERMRQAMNKRTGYSRSERYAAGRHDFADCKKMDLAHAMRRGYLLPAETEAKAES